MAMKESGIEWVGLIPDTWSVIPNKYVMHKEKNLCEKWTGEDVMSLTMNGVIVRDLQNPTGKMPATFDGYQYIEDGDLLMCLFDIDVTPRCVGRVTHDGVTSPAYSNFKMHDNASRDYFYYYYLMVDNTKELLHLAKNLRHSFTEEQLGQLKVPMPPLSEQQAIADYLDKTCSKIDEIIAEAKASIDEYKELKQSTLCDAVLRGLNSQVVLKNSGASWIGMIPEHWQTAKLKWHLRRIDPKNPGEKEVLSLYRDYGVIPKNSRTDNHNVTSEDTSKYKYVRIGDFVVNKMKAWQGSVAVSDYEGIVSPAYYVYHFLDDVFNKRYFHHLLRSCYKEEFMRLSGGIRTGQWDLSSNNLDNIILLVPPKNEQDNIVEYLDNRLPQIDSLIAEKESLINDLEAYKKSLIYEVVTGKRRVV